MDTADAVHPMRDAIKELISPEAVALIVAYLQGATCRNKDATREVEWFAAQLVEAVGGPDAVSVLFDEIGV